MSPEVQLHKYVSSPEEVLHLRRLSTLWHEETGFWSFDHVLKSLEHRQVSLAYLTEPDSAVWIAALLAMNTGDQMDLIYVYVLPEMRRKKLAVKLLEDLFERSKGISQCRGVFLEVNVNNVSAHRLYESFGFAEVRRIPKYYRGVDDAICYLKSF